MKLALGTAQFGMAYGINNVAGKVTQRGVQAILEYATSVGIDTVDTAVAYGDSEHVLGNIGVEAFKVVTKLPEIPHHVADVEAWVIGAVEESVARLGVENLYGLLLHRPGQLFESRGVEIMLALRYLKGTGVTKNLGVSVSSPSELDALYTLYDFDIVQCPFNLVDRRLSESGWLQRLKNKEVEIHVRSAFLQGLLLMPKENIPLKFAPWVELFGKWDTWLSNNSISAIQACLAYPLSFSEVDRVVVGVDSVNQLKQIINTAQKTMPSDLPDLQCEDENLINPARWSQL